MDSLLFFRNLDTLHFFELFNAALDLLSLGRRVAETVDENFKLLDAIALSLVSGFELLLARRFAGEILIVVAGVEMHLLVPDFHDAFHGDIKKIAVMRNEDERIRISGQVLLKP